MTVHPFRTPTPADLWHAKTEAQLVALNAENAQYDDSVGYRFDPNLDRAQDEGYYPATFEGTEYVTTSVTLARRHRD